jgi:hypothetical protein
MEAGFILVLVLIRVVVGIASAAIANHKGRSVVGWFFGGFFLEIIGLIIVAVLPNLKQQQAEKQQAQREQRRLREQLRQERLKSEAYRDYSANRLDMHDDALGVDTRSPQALTGGAVAPPRLTQGPNPLIHAEETVSWYYAIKGERRGPVREDVIRQKLLKKELGPDTLVWNEDLIEWTPANETTNFILET